MSDERANITGSAAREHEATGGNAKAGQSNLPGAGSAALAAETEAREADRLEYRSANSMSLPLVRGAKMVAATEPGPDLSQRTAADYLPARLKAQLIAEGKLTAAGELVTKVTPASPEPTPSASMATTSNNGVEAAEPARWAGSLVRRLRNLFS